MNILSEPLVNYVILFSFQFFFHYRDLQFIRKIVILNYSEKCSSSSHVAYYCI